MSELKSFRDLKVWQKASDLAVEIYLVTEKFPKSELYGITSQMRRAVISISSNIAEGFKRSHSKEKIQFYYIAYGSTTELESQIEISFKLKFISDEQYIKLCGQIVEVSKMLDGLIKSSKQLFNSPFIAPKSYILNPIFFLAFLFSISYLLNPSSSLAASSILEGDGQPILNSQWKVSVFVKSDQEKINTFAGRIGYPQQILEVSEVRDAGSIINFWVEPAKVIEAGAISFAGITPGGWQGDRGSLLEIIFRVKEAGKGLVEFNQGEAYLNDGNGTRTTFDDGNLSFDVSSAGTPASYEISDKIPPEPFKINLGRSPSIYDNRWFVAFSTEDEQSGIDHYEVVEGGSEEPPTKGWKTFVGNYVLSDQGLESYVFVKAIDKKGNSRIEVLPPAIVKANYQKYLISGTILIVAISAYLWFQKRRGK